MPITSYIGAIAASVLNRKKRQSLDRQRVGAKHPIDNVSKEQFYKWMEEGKCSCCGAESGEYKGICDECRLS